jgi:hypothetical protein
MMMPIRWDLLVPLLIVMAIAVGQSALTMREIRTREVSWWAKIKWPTTPRRDYADPTMFRMRQIANGVLSLSAAALAFLLLIKFLGF